MDNLHLPIQLPETSPPPARQRQLRSVLVCDIVDSTALVERLGDARGAELIQRHDQLARVLVERHHGREIDKTDGFLLLFERPSQAVAFALEYHAGLALLAESSATPLQARVGIHMGEVVSWENPAPAVARGAKPVEVEGLAKPIAARLAQLALPRQTLLSSGTATVARRAQDEIVTGSTALTWMRHGRYRLKGLPEPIGVVEAGIAGSSPLRAPGNSRTGARLHPFRTPALLAFGAALLVAAAAGYWQWHARVIPPAPANSIVVLPFVNIGNDPTQRYFSNGITVELTDALGKDTGLAVIAWETASRFAGSHATPAEIGRDLHVANVLGGSIQRDGDVVRVTAELVNTTSGRQVWSAHYDGSTHNVFAMEDQITAAIASALQVKFAGLRAAPTSNPDAHDLYLKGLAEAYGFTAEGARQADDYYRQALQLDPDYATAWAALALNENVLTQVSTVPITDALPTIRRAAHKALALDPRNAKAMVALGLADGADNRVDAARARLREALAIDPNNVAALLAYGNLLPLDQARVQEQKAARLDPDNLIAQNNLAAIYQDLSDWPQMVATSHALAKLAPHYIDTAFGLAFAYTQMRRGEDAVKAFDAVRPATALDQQLVDAGRLTYRALLQASLRTTAQAALDALGREKLNPHASNALAQLYLALGDKQDALERLPGLCSAVPVGCADLAINPVFAPLHGNRQFEKLAQQYTTVTVQ